jgi:hypothetical protein
VAQRDKRGKRSGEIRINGQDVGTAYTRITSYVARAYIERERGGKGHMSGCDHACMLFGTGSYGRVHGSMYEPVACECA